MKTYLLTLLLLVWTAPIARAAALQTRNVFLITADGLRWQEVFSGAEELLISKEHGGVGNTNAILRDYWRATPEERRRVLFPFLWSEIATKGQLWGNQTKRSIVRVTNGQNFSYPGYNELLTGRADPSIDSNEKKPNPNVNVLEWLNKRPGFAGKAAAFGCWDVFPFILNRERAGIFVKAGWEIVDEPYPGRDAIHAILRDTTRVWDGVIYDAFMFHAAFEYIKTKQPRVTYLAFGETDDWAHEGRYDFYLQSARNFDGFVRRLWDLVQSIPAYRGQTTFILTSDHGRGSGPVAWKNHSRGIAESASIWVAVLGPDTTAKGERSDTKVVTQNQIAGTVAAFLGENYQADFPQAGAPIEGVMSSEISR